MTPGDYLDTARTAAREAAQLLRDRFGEVHEVNQALQNDLKLALDVESQRLITDRILAAHPDHGIYGEEGIGGNPASEYRWIIDPIDGTVNFFYGIPHFAVSVALQRRGRTVVGVIIDPMQQEVWSVAEALGAGGSAADASAADPGGPVDASAADPGDPADASAADPGGPADASAADPGGPADGASPADGVPRLGDKRIAVSPRERLSEAIVMTGFAKSPDKIEEGLRRYRLLAPEVRKIRMLGSAALAMTYVATGRLDAYVEETVSLWDVAAGKLLVEAAGGRVELTPHEDRSDRYSVVCWNGKLPILELLSRL